MDLSRLRALAGITESAPPGMEDTVRDLKKQYPGEPEKAFATAWSIYNKQHGKVEEQSAEDTERAELAGDKGFLSGVEVPNPDNTASHILADVEFTVQRGDDGDDFEITAVYDQASGADILDTLSGEALIDIEDEVELRIASGETLSENSEEDAVRWAEDLFRGAGVALPHQTRVKHDFKKLTGGKRRPDPEPIADKGESFDALIARRAALDKLLPLVKERDRLVYKAERWGPLPPAVKLDIDDAHIPVRDIDSRIEKTEKSIELLKGYIATKRSLYKPRAVAEGYSGDVALDAEISKMLQNASDGFVSKDDALARVAYYLLDMGIDHTRVEEIMSAIEQQLAGDEALTEARELLATDEINGLLDLDTETAKQKAIGMVMGSDTREKKKEYLLKQINSARNAVAIVRVLYNMVLSGEGNSVIGSTYKAAVRESDVEEGAEPAQLSYRDASKLAQRIDDEKLRRLKQDSEREVHNDTGGKTWRDILLALQSQPNTEEATTEDINNGYGDERMVDGDDYFPDGATGSIVGAAGPRGAAQGDNPMQKSIKVDETFRRLQAAYQKHLNEEK